jgi:hypothetical protein
MLLMTIVHAVEGDGDQMPNETLNNAGHSFTCSMRFNDVGTEIALLWFWFWITLSCLAIVGLVFGHLRRL